ncbi:helix-turn-helix transcriptional regulator [Streptomyces sp. SID3343]|uniref:helix-turn-helix domain-containing protein n=1 Tax=Streptomyces sp. SID3343 TaxID=2690260 RepID=UPI00136D2CDD|nr:helix-turn-helix transcriptional regulator [Streptomyces sp. SID3343]MYW01168.1 hypothetical protein [Streptomyces sp. SID3343]MYW04152.1 hypothetical protein [Streptomyces sp. SID3343]
MSDDIPGRDAVEPDAGRYGAAMQACFERAGASRREFAKAAFLDPSVVTRYLKGQRVAPAEFLTALARFLAERGVPLAPEEHLDLDRLRTAALAGSARQHNQALYWREETTRLTAAKEDLTARLNEERDRGTHDRRHAAQALGALDLELAELSERLEHTDTTRAEIQTRHDALHDQVRDRDHRLDAATAYIRELEAELAEHHATIELLRREVDVLRHQVMVLSREQQERQWATPVHQHVAQAATQVTADGVSGDHDPPAQSWSGGVSAMPAYTGDGYSLGGPVPPEGGTRRDDYDPPAQPSAGGVTVTAMPAYTGGEYPFIGGPVPAEVGTWPGDCDPPAQLPAGGVTAMPTPTGDVNPLVGDFAAAAEANIASMASTQSALERVQDAVQRVQDAVQRVQGAMDDVRDSPRNTDDPSAVSTPAPAAPVRPYVPYQVPPGYHVGNFVGWSSFLLQVVLSFGVAATFTAGLRASPRAETSNLIVYAVLAPTALLLATALLSFPMEGLNVTVGEPFEACRVVSPAALLAGLIVPWHVDAAQPWPWIAAHVGLDLDRQPWHWLADHINMVQPWHWLADYVGLV